MRLPLLAFALCAAIVFARSPGLFVHPFLFAEDGTELFARFFQEQDPGAVFRSYAGYASLVPNLLGYVAARFPLALQPHLLSAFAGLLSALACSVFASRRFRYLVRSDGARTFACALLALLPAGNYRLASVTMYSLWHLLLIASLLALTKAPRTRRESVREMLFAGACLVSHPLSIVLAPVYGLRAWQERRARRHYAALFAIAIGYQWLFVQQGTRAPVDIGTAAWNSVQMLLLRVVEEPLIGLSARVGLMHAGLHWLELALGLGAMIGFGLAVRSLRGAMTSGFLVAGYAIVAMVAAVAFTRESPLGPGLEWNHRYSFVPRVLFYLLVVVLVLRGLSSCSRATRIGGMALLVLHGLFLNLHNHGYYAGSAAESERVLQFCSEAETWRRRPDDPRATLTLDRHVLPITLRRPEGASPRPVR